MSGATFNQRNAHYSAPDTTPTEYLCRRIRIPKHLNIIAAVNEVLSYLALPNVWEPSENVTEPEMQALMSEVWYEYGKSECMIGSIVPTIRDELPEHMLLCDGSIYNRVDYPDLYSVLDPAYILSADTFMTPDLRGVTVIGASDSYPVNSTGGEASHTLTEAEMPAHSHITTPHQHTYSQPTFGIDVESVGVPDPTGVGNPPLPQVTSLETVTVQNTGGGEAHNNMQPYRALKYAVVAK